MCLDHPYVQDILSRVFRWHVTYGISPQADYFARNIRYSGLKTSFAVWKRQELFGEFVVNMLGIHNVLNCLAVVAVAAACLGIAFGAWQLPSRASHANRSAGEPALPVAQVSAEAHSSRLTLADGSEAILGPDGNVQVEEQAPTQVRLRQRAGSARYVVRPDPAREFVVLAEGVAVHVRGTIFSVTIGSESIEVSVERGRVEVAGGMRTRDLVAGEAFSVPLHPKGDDGADGTGAPSQAGLLPAAAPAPAVTTATPSPAALLARADDARAAGNPSEAARVLEIFASTYPHEGRLPAALFTLGRVERASGHPEAAASAFERCAVASPGGPLSDDALAEAAQAWNAAGAVDRARADANAYLRAHPGGIHAAGMRAIGSR